jgi:hypothetical protein
VVLEIVIPAERSERRDPGLPAPTTNHEYRDAWVPARARFARLAGMTNSSADGVD